MPSFLSKFRHSPLRPPRQPSLPRNLPNIVPDEPCQRLDFWVIQDQNRNGVVERIVPYMTGKVPEEQQLESLIEEKPWIEELILSEDDDDANDNDFEQLRETEAAFWKAPEAMVDELRDVTRSWFRMLLRYTFRAKHRDGWKKASPTLDLEDLHHDDFTSQLEDKQIQSLTRRPNLYGDYRDSYKETKSRPAWTRFCTRMKTLIQLLGLQTTSSKLEQILQDLENDLPRLKSDRILRLNDSLILCRQLMENLLPELPAAKGTWRPRGQEYGKRWRELFQEQWKRCKEKRRVGHPFLGLVDEAKYYPVGEKLYGTLSERLHNHQEHRDKQLDADVLRVVFSILPPVFSLPPTAEKDRRWDLDVEKKRWGLT